MPPHPEPAPAIDAAAGGSAKREYVRRAFSDIAPRYDLLNHLLSASVDRGWRRAAVAALDVARAPGGVYLDCCAGTMDVSAELARARGFHGTVVAADFAEPMLRAGLRKTEGRAVSPIVADALSLPFASASVAGAIIAFGLRNLASLEAGLGELRRVLAPRARLVVLEFSTPRAWPVRMGYHAYLRGLLPLVGRVVSGHASAYRYLPASIAHWPSPDALALHLERAGFAGVSWRPLTFGIAALHAGQVPHAPAGERSGAAASAPSREGGAAPRGRAGHRAPPHG